MSEFWYLHGDKPDLDDMFGTVAIDTETTGLRWTDSLLGVSLAWHNPAHDIRSCYFTQTASLLYDDIWPDDKVRG